jgi:hypothetical protein
MCEPIYVQDFPCTSAAQLMAALLELHTVDRPTNGPELGKEGWIFRGHSDSRWPLLPSAHRTNGRNSAFWKRSLQGCPVDPEKYPERYLGTHVHEEMYTVKWFLETADKLALPTPIDYAHFRLHAEEIDSLWNKRGTHAYLANFPDERLWPVFGLAQHYGVLTRFLDWTESPLVAAYFAALGASKLVDQPSRRNDGSIAVISLHTYGPAERGIEVVRVPRYQNRFLHAQSGLFTVIPRANAFFICNNGRWPSIHDLLGTSGALKRWSLPVTEADELLKLLFPFNITRHHLMPTLENAARVVDYWTTVLP